MSKKAESMTKEVIFRIENSLTDCPEWDKLFNDNENITNAITIGILNKIDSSINFAQAVMRLEDFMPKECIIKHAKYKAMLEGVYVPDVEPLNNFLQKIEDRNRFKEGPPNKDEWEYLNHYYIEPLENLSKELEELTFDID